ncbi:MAG TPA: hypothetical protein VLZ74_11175 [Methylocella sp.]|nr:hypothetical protein [Methylocella sp.]
MTEQLTNICLVLLAIPAAIMAVLDIRSRLKSKSPASGTSKLRWISLVFTVLLIALLAYVMATGGIGRATAFIAYYGESGDLRVVGSKVDSPISLPNHIGCPQQTGVPVETALSNICGSTATLYYRSIGISGGGACGFNVFAGVCIKKLPLGLGG